MPKFHRVVYAVLDTITSATETEEDARKDAEDIIREQNGCAADKGIIRITSHEEDVQNPITLKDVIKVQEPLRSWPSPAAIAAHKTCGGRWLCELESIFGNPPAVKIGQFYENTVFADYRLEDYCYETGRELWRLCLKFGPVDENYNRMPWPTDGKGKPL